MVLIRLSILPQEERMVVGGKEMIATFAEVTGRRGAYAFVGEQVISLIICRSRNKNETCHLSNYSMHRTSCLIDKSLSSFSQRLSSINRASLKCTLD
jgi:hypothetical protein